MENEPKVETYTPDEEKTPEPSGWDAYLSSPFLKAENIENEGDTFNVTKVEEIVDDRDKDNVQKLLRLHLRCFEEKFLFDLNKTNTAFIKNSGVAHPKDLTGKNLQFKKVMVMNPQLKKEVEGLRISNVI
jgi:hypothetical protein